MRTTHVRMRDEPNSPAACGWYGPGDDWKFADAETGEEVTCETCVTELVFFLRHQDTISFKETARHAQLYFRGHEL